MKSTSNILKMLSKKSEKVFWALGLHAFLLILFLIFIDLILGSFIFYKYVFLIGDKSSETTGDIVKFDVNKYNHVLEELEIRNSSI